MHQHAGSESAEVPSVAEQTARIPASVAAVEAGAPGILELQRLVGNRAVSRLVARPAHSARVLARKRYADRDFLAPKIQAVFDRNQPATKHQQWGLEVLDFNPLSPPTGKWANLSWPNIAEQAAERVFHPNLIAQKDLGVCDMAAVLNFKATVDPWGYAGLASECFTKGTLEGSKVNATLLANTPMPGQDEVDWMLLSGMTDLTNDWYSYYGRPDPPGTSKREGFLEGDDKWALKKFAGAVETKVIDTPKAEDVIPATKTVNDLLTRYPRQVAVLIRLSASVLKNPASAENTLNHTVRLTKPAAITEDPDPTKGTVGADIFTWGRILSWSGTERQYQHMVWAYVAASTTSGVL